MKQLIVVMGVSGSGKSHIGRALAQTLHVPFLEGDDFHPDANIKKMAGGTPLTNQDRIAWIDAMGEAIVTKPEQRVVLSCSALNEFVRNRLQEASGRQIDWIYLNVSREELLRRLHRRKKHFMKADLLDSQLAAMHPPETAYMVQGHLSPRDMILDISRYLDSLSPKGSNNQA